MADLAAQTSVRTNLESDPLRTVAAAVIATLALGGWAYSLSKPALRATFPAQSATWWFEQFIILLQALACLALARGVVQAWRPAPILTVAAFVITTLAWVQDIRLSGRHPIPVTPIFNALLLWRLWRSNPPAASRRVAT